MSIDWTYWPSDPYWSQAGFWDFRPPWIRPARPTSIRWALRQSVAPTIEPVDLARAKNWLRVDIDDDDALIADIIATARDYCEGMTGVGMLGQTWQMYLDRFPLGDRPEYWPWSAQPGAILLPRYPVQSVTSIVYTDSNGTPTTVAGTDYVLDNVSTIPRIVPAANKSWPGTSFAPQNAVVVTFPVGYTLATLPPKLQQAVKMLIGLYYANREDIVIGTRLVAITVPKAVDALLAQHQPAMVG
jgi:uncharacterized phiE125 gp8 family phage protein